MNNRKLFAKILSGSDNTRFGDLVKVVEAFGFQLVRTKGSHHIFNHTDFDEMLNLQNKKGKAKPYQIRQFLLLVDQHHLDLDEEA
jgi:hypothetical protein